MAPEVQERTPYVGPRPFEQQDRGLFFGRDREASEVLSLVIAHPVLLLYGQAGAGKTSLVNAGLIPLLEEEGFEVLPLARVRGLIPEDIEPEDIPNLYAFNTLVSWLEDAADPRQLAKMSLAEFLKEREHPTDEEGLLAPRAAIFDQFEELFTFYPERWRDREGFFEQVGDALEEDPLLRVVFVIREDYIAQLDPYAPLLPQELRTRFRLERLRLEAALSAATKPLRDMGRAFAKDAAEELVKELLKVRVETGAGETKVITGEFIEPVQFQVVCQSLWQGLSPDVTVITQEDLQVFGDVNQALSGFYERSIKRTAQETGVKEGDLRRWFEDNLITPAGTRGMVYRGREKTGEIPNAAADLLENLHLIRGEWRAGARWYELTHDRFIEPIQASNKMWLAERWEAEQTRQRLEAKAREWMRLGRGRAGLLDRVELLEAERWLADPDAADLGCSEALLALLQASRATIEEAEREKEVAAGLVTRLRVFVASPNDVEAERDSLKDVIEELNLGIAEEKGLVLELVRWETHTWPGIGKDAQDVINRQIGPFDVFIGIMWKRFGTPTKRAESGTKEEFKRAYELWKKYGRPHLMFYFNKTPSYPSSVQEWEQMGKVLIFKEEIAKGGLYYWEYESPDDFEKYVRRHLTQVIRK